MKKTVLLLLLAISAFAINVEYHLVPGWNMKTMPCVPESPIITDNFGDVTVFVYSTDTRAYVAVDSFPEIGVAFWVFSFTDTIFTVECACPFDPCDESLPVIINDELIHADFYERDSAGCLWQLEIHADNENLIDRYVQYDGVTNYKETLKELNIEFTGVFDSTLMIDMADIGECSVLSSLRLYFPPGIEEISLDNLSSSEMLEILDLSSNAIPELDIAPISELPILWNLDFSDNNLTEINMDDIGSIENLEELNLSYNEIESVDLAPLAECSQLRTLDLKRNNLITFSINLLDSLEFLTLIDITANPLDTVYRDSICIFAETHPDCEVRTSFWCGEICTIEPVVLGGDTIPEDWIIRNPGGCVTSILLNFLITENPNFLDGVERYSSTLQSIALPGSLGIDSISLEPLASCTLLTSLEIGYYEITSIDLTPLASLTNLRELTIGRNRISSIDLTPLASLTNLRELTIWRNPISSIDLSPLSSTALEYLRIEDNSLTSIDLTPLSGLPLRELLLYYNELDSIDLTPLSTVNIARLDLSDNHLSHIDLTPLNFTYLTALSLGSNSLDSIEMPIIADTIALSSLSVRYNNFTDFDLSFLAFTPELEHLNLSYNLLTSIDLSDMANPEELRSLYLEENELESIIFPDAFSNYLTSLNIRNNNLTELDLAPFEDIYTSSRITYEFRGNPFTPETCSSICEYETAREGTRFYINHDCDCGD